MAESPVGEYPDGLCQLPANTGYEENAMPESTWTAAPSSVVAKLRRELERAKKALEAANETLNGLQDADQYLPDGQRQSVQKAAVYVEDLATSVKRKA